MFVSEDRPSHRTTHFPDNRAARTQSATLCYGRFLQADPLGYEDGLNMYGYVGGDPVNHTDPTGLKLRWVCAGLEGSETCGYKDDGGGGGGGGIPGNGGGGGGIPSNGGGGGVGSSTSAPALPQSPCGGARAPTATEQVGGFILGAADAVTFGAYSPLVSMIPGSGVDAEIGSTGYEAGNLAVGAIGGLRLAYAGIAKTFGYLGGKAAVDARNALKGVFSGLGNSHPRIKGYDSLLSKYGSDKAVAAAASRTNPKVNTAGGVGAAGAATNQCGRP